MTFWKGRRVFVTGATGLLGSWLTQELLSGGAAVTTLVRDWVPGSRLVGEGLLERTHVVRGDLEDRACLTRALNEYEVDTVFHLGAQTIVGTAARSALSTFESNIRGTWTLLEAARQSRFLQGLVFASTDKVYGDQPVLPYDEGQPLAAAYPYDASKLCAETLARSYAATYQLPLAVVRCANIYGPGDLNWSRVVPGTIRSMLAGEAPVIRSDGTLERDYLFVADAVDAYLTLARHVPREDVRGQAFNFGWGRGYSVLEIVDAILAHGALGLRPRILGENRGEIQRQWLSSEKATRVLQWAPRVPLEEGIARSVEWYREFLRTGPTEPAAVAVNGGRRE